MSKKKRRKGGGSDSGHHFVMGKNSLREVLRSCPDRILKLHVSESFRSNESGNEELFDLIRKENLTCDYVESEALHTLVDSRSHQGFVAELKAFQFFDLQEIVKRESGKEQSLILCLDSVLDPHNVGALLRAAECFGAAAVVWSRNRSSGVTPVVTKVSMGASELIPIVEIGNLAQSLEKLKKADYWTVLTDGGDGSQSLAEFEFPGRAVLVLGSEGAGASDLVRGKADFTVKIDMFGQIDSLNVSQAGAVFLARYRQAFGVG